jgi:threonylcarbamoyladenosine tRNA methylthiotransferase MtaB
MSIETVTFGCRLNTQESEAMRQSAAGAGLNDVAIVNSCAVTGEAVKQARQAIRRLARERPDRPIVVTGCAAQTEPGTFAAMPEVARVLGNAGKVDPEVWRRLFAPGAGRLAVTDIMAGRSAAGPMIDAVEGRARAILQVQNGCDHRCTFCVIPFGRGPSCSTPPEAVVEQAARLVGNGYRELVVTGVDVTSYGHDLPDRTTLGALLKRLLRALPDLERLRLSSVDSIEIDPDLMELIGGEPRFMPHLHLSLQAGDDLILKRMKRRHLRDDAIRFCAEARRLRPDIVFGADLIAGFPTEDEAMFENSLRLVEECGLTRLHVFPYSPRPGTPAARMPQVPHAIVRERAARLRAEGERRLAAHLQGRVGRSLTVLTERGGVGRAADFTAVRLAAQTPPGEMRDVAIAGHDGRMLLAA